VVSLGQAVVVPDVVGMTEVDAKSATTAVGLVVANVTYEYSDTVAAGVVISQNPTGGTTVPIGSSVDLVVSLGQPLAALVLGGNRLVELQNNDGGWDWPLDDGDPNGGSDSETFAEVAMGLAWVHRQTGDPNTLAALQKAKTFLLSKTDNFVGTDGALAVELDSILGGTDCVNYVSTNFYDKLEAGTYYDARSGATHDTGSYVQALRDLHTGTNFAAWELGIGLYSAHIIGASTTDWIAGVKAEIDELDGNQFYDVLGLAGAVFGLAAVGEDHDPQAGEHIQASSLNDLADILAAYQLETGGFTQQSTSMQPSWDEAVKETVYALLALNEVDRQSYLAEIYEALIYLQSAQLETGGWENNPGCGEINESSGEALQGIAVAAILLGDFDNDHDVDLTDFAIFAAAWLTEPGDTKWNLRCDISDPHDGIIDELDLAVLSKHWLKGTTH